MKYMIWASYLDRPERFFVYRTDDDVVKQCKKFRKSKSNKSPLGWSVFKFHIRGEYKRLTNEEMTEKGFWE